MLFSKESPSALTQFIPQVGWVERSETQQRGNSSCTMKRQSSLIKDELAQGEVSHFRDRQAVRPVEILRIFNHGLYQFA